MTNFLEECSKLNKILKENYNFESDCVFEYNKNEINAMNKSNEKDPNKLNISPQIEKFKTFAFSKDGQIIKLIKFYEESNYEKMKDELMILEKLAKFFLFCQIFIIFCF